MYSEPTCHTCGDQIKYHQPKTWPTGRVTGGWVHADGLRRDHTTHPSDNRSIEVETQRQRDLSVLARLTLDSHIQKQFDTLNAQRVIDSL